ncbi:MAG: exo-alpha-sialidase [Clostridia bacterium]|nr:exo-alpha-sialidase [Clostridia bacterium]
MKKLLSVLIVVCMLATTMMPIFAAEEDWYTGWTESGTVTRSGSTVLLKDAGITKSLTAPSNKFDIELEFKRASSGYSTIAISNGVARLYAIIDADRLTYNIPGWTTSNSSTHRKHLMYPIGASWHHYRFIGQGNLVEVYIDDYFMGEIEVQSRTDSIISINGGTGTAAEVRNVKINDASKVSIGSSGGSSSSSGGEVVSPTYPVEPYYYDFVNGENLSDWENNKVNRWRVEDGMLRGDNNMHVASEMNEVSRKTGFSDDFVLTARLRWPVRNTDVPLQSGIYIRWDNCQFHLKLTYQQFTYYNGVAGRAVGNGPNLTGDLRGQLDSNWREIRLETYNYCEGVRVYLGENLLFDGYIKRFASQTGMSTVAFYTEQNFLGEAESCMDIDWVKYEPITYNIEMEEPLGGSKYAEGTPIYLNANVLSNSEEIPYVDYRINGSIVARGMAPDYRAELKNIGEGKYSVTAEYGDQVSTAVTFEVVQSIRAGLNVIPSGKGYVLNADLYDRVNNVKKVQFVVDGKVVGEDTSAPFSYNLSSLTPEPHKLSAYFCNEAGLILSVADYDWKPSLTPSSVSRSYTNEISYTVSGGTGSGTYEMSNGHHKVLLTHTPEKVTYMTADGEESFAPGTGDFYIITQGPYADVYRNGQFSFSYYLPQTSEVSQSYKQNGLTFSNKYIASPKERGTFFADSNIAPGRYTYRLPSLPYIFKTAFVADKADNVRIAVNDSIFRTDVELKDGKIYVWTLKFDASDPEYIELCDAVDADNVYYHFDTVGGMNRIYANGKFLSSFRSIAAAGEPSVLIDVKAGDGISYMNITENQDLFIYKDDFSNSAEFDSVYYWQDTKGMEVTRDESKNMLSLNAVGKQNAVAELTSYSGDQSLSADVIVNGKEGGFWILAQHSHTEKWTKVGYNFDTGKYEIVYNYDGNVRTLTSKEGTFPTGESVHVEFIVENDDPVRTMTFLVNGIPTISYVDQIGYNRGKMGFMITNNSVLVDNVDFRGDARPVLGVTDHVIEKPTGATHDIIEHEDKLQITTEVGYSFYTEDGGKTWTNGPTKVGYYEQNMLQLTKTLEDGTRVLGDEVLTFVPGTTGGTDANGNALGNTFVKYSPDRGETWEDWGTLYPEPIGDAYAFTADGVKQGPSGRLYAAVGRGDLIDPGVFAEDAGVIQCVYSDDGGRTWTQGGIVSYKDVKSVVNEAQILESHDGVVTMYYRTDLGMVRAVKSYDGGDTFDTEHVYRTPFLSAANCFGMTVDPIDGKTLYAAWGHDNANLSAQNQQPRQRWSLARSLDDGETWEFLGSIYECTFGGPSNTNMNTMMNVTTDYLMVNGYRLDKHNVNIHTYSGTDLVRKDTLKSTKAFEQLHLCDTGTLERYWGTVLADMATYIIADDSNGVVLVDGRKVENAAQNGEILLDCVASYIGAKIETGANGEVVLAYGDAKVAISNVTNKNGRYFVNRESIANQFGFGIFTTDSGICYMGNTGKVLASIEKRFKNGLEIAK